MKKKEKKIYFDPHSFYYVHLTRTGIAAKQHNWKVFKIKLDCGQSTKETLMGRDTNFYAKQIL